MYEEKPFSQGILDTEELCFDTNKDSSELLIFKKGPIMTLFSNEFMIRFRRQNTLEFITKIYKLPDAKEQTILIDFNKKIEMSSFLLDDDQIIIKGSKRFILFDSAGEFIHRIHFYDENKEKCNMENEDLNFLCNHEISPEETD